MSKEKSPIRILNVVPNMRAAGIETFIMNVYRNIDVTKVQFDFLVHNKEQQFYDEEIEKMGGKIYRLTLKDDKNFFKYIKDLNSFFKKHKEYNIIHGHMQSMIPLYLFIAARNKVKVRIAHSHNGDYEKTLKGFILHLFSRFAKTNSTYNFACSDIAGKYLFGKNKYEVIYNGVNVEKFKFNPKTRKELRKKIKIEDDTTLIGHVGRFEKQKNHEYIISIATKLKENNPNFKFKIALIGEGKLLDATLNLIKEKELEDNFIYLGLRKDVDKLYNAFDVFILPSLYEGLPVVGIEAQINNLNCLFSINITKELNISTKTKFISLSNVEEWVNEIINSNRNKLGIIDEKKFDIKLISKEITRKYIEYENNN